MILLIVAIIIVLLILLSIYIYKESEGYHVVNYDLTDNRIKSDKVTIVFLSDLHNRQYGEKNVDLLRDIDDISPDYVFIGGDMITSCLEKWHEFSNTMDFMKNLSSKYKVIYGMGNHEERLRRKPEKFPEGAYNELTKCLLDMGCPILVDECVHLDDGIDVYGLDLEHAYYRKVITKKIPDGHLESKLGVINKDRFSILLAHNPEHFKSYSKWGANLTLSGHVHGGIIRLPILGGVISPALKIFPKYDGGMFEDKGNYMILSRGIGTHTVPIRVNNKAEIVVINLFNKR